MSYSTPSALAVSATIGATSLADVSGAPAAAVLLSVAASIASPAFDPLPSFPSGLSLSATIATPSVGSDLYAGSMIRADYSGSEFDSLVPFGAPAGVRVTRVGGLNGPGVGALICRPNGQLAWRAPRSGTSGDYADVSGGGTFVLRDGEMPDRWIEVAVSPAHLACESSGVHLRDAIPTALCAGNVTAAQAASGNVATRVVTLRNASAVLAAVDALVWLDARVRFIELSWDGASWFAPQTQAAALAGMGAVTIAASGTQSLHVRRTIPAATGHVFAEPIIIYGAFARGSFALRGAYRIFGAAGYNVYWEDGRVPEPGKDTVRQFSATLPVTPTATLADGDWHIAVTHFDGLTESLAALHRVTIAGGDEVDNAPGAADRVWCEQAEAGEVTLRALYGTLRGTATHWLVWWTDDGSAPSGTGTPDDSLSIDASGIVATLSLPLGSHAHATVIRAVVRLANGDARGQAVEATLTVALLAPGAPVAGKFAMGGRGARISE